MSVLSGARRVLLVHAHPDDETLATGALIAELVERGVEVRVVTATRGERGELTPAVSGVEPGSDQLVALREGELASALRTLQVAGHAFLGSPPARAAGQTQERTYRDSGMRWITETVAGPADDSDGESLTAAKLSDAAADLEAYVDAIGPDVLISYDENGGYGHPDHVRTQEITREVAKTRGLPMLEVIPPDREVGGDLDRIEWSELSAHLPSVREALQAHASQLTVDGDEVVHVGGQREPIVTRIGLRPVEL